MQFYFPALFAKYWLGLRVWIALLFRMWSAWLPFPAPGIGVLSSIATGDKSAEPYLDYMRQPLEKNPRLINKKEELKTVCYKLFFICVTFI